MEKPIISKEKKLTKSKQIALSGIICALCVTLMFSTGLVPVFTYAVPSVAGYFMLILSIETDFKTAIVAYFAVSLLSVLTTPDKAAALIFVVFFGHYGILQTKLNLIKNKILRWIVKFIIFNIILVIGLFLSVKISGLEEVVSDLDFLGKYLIPVVFVVTNGFFVAYDISLSLLQKTYLSFLRPRYFKTKK